MRQKHCWNYFAPAVLLTELNDFTLGGSGLDRTDDLQKFCGLGLDRIQFYLIRTGLGLKNVTVRSSLLLCHKNEQCFVEFVLQSQHETFPDFKIQPRNDLND